MRVVFFAGAVWLCAVPVLAQQPQTIAPQPRIASVFPPGGKVGTTIDVIFLGTDLDDPTALQFSHPGFKGVFVPPPEPEEPKVDPKAKTPPPKPPKKPAPPTDAKFKITIAPDVAPGSYDVRLINKWGISNPRLFTVGTRPELLEKEPNNDIPEAQPVELGTTISGVISSATDVDYSVFTGQAGQRVLVSCVTASIDSKARPLIEIFSADGRRVAQNRSYTSGGDALADLTLPVAGAYHIRLTEFAHIAGSADSFYRMTVYVGPWIDAVFPPMIPHGSATAVTVYGRNLPGGARVKGLTIDGQPVDSLMVNLTPTNAPGELKLRQRIDPPQAVLDGFEYRLAGPGGPSNAVPVATCSGRMLLEADTDNNQLATAQELTLPCQLAGHIEKQYDRDWYKFTAKKGESYVVELLADRLGSTMDTYLTLRGGKDGKDEIAGENLLDDDVDSVHPTLFFSRSTDPTAFLWKVPADGVYWLLVGSREANVSYGPRCSYVLRIQPYSEDFRAFVMARGRELPTTATLHPDGEIAYDILLDRAGGFVAPVTITVEGLPAGATAHPCRVGTKQRWATLVISGAASLKDGISELRLKATTTLNGKPTTRDVRPASITWGIPGQNNVPTVARLDQSLPLATRADRAPFRIQTDLKGATNVVDGKPQPLAAPFFVKPGTKINVPLKIVWHDKDPRSGPVNLIMEPTTIGNNATGITLNNNQPFPIAKEKTESPIELEVKVNAVPGLYTVALRGETPLKFTKDPTGKDKKDINVVAYAVPFEVMVLPKSLGQFKVLSPGNLKLGSTVEMTVTVERQFDFTGPYKLVFDLPKGTVGVSIEPATIAAGQSEVKVKITVTKDAKPGNLPNIGLTATARFEDVADVLSEMKFSFNISK